MQSTTSAPAVNATNLRRLLAAFLSDGPDAGSEPLNRAALADCLEEGCQRPLASQLRGRSGWDRDWSAVLACLPLCGVKVGRKSLASWLDGAAKAAGSALFAARRDRIEHPDGEFDKQGRWYPSDDEDCGDFRGAVRSPSANWPYSYMLRARTREHCRLLIAASVMGHSVPAPAAARAKSVRQQLITLLSA